MNLYFLVEGDSTEKKVYRKLIPYLLPELIEVRRFDEAKENNFFIFTGGGYPNIKNILLNNAVSDVKTCGNYDYLVVVVDTDNENNDDKIRQYAIDNNVSFNSNCKLHVIAQNPCLETWFLGHRQIYLIAANDENFLNYAKFYNVSENDPELMLKPDGFIGSTSNYHGSYLKKMLAAQNINYSKKKPANVVKPEYLDELKNRISETNHLSSLKNFFSFCETISAHNQS